MKQLAAKNSRSRTAGRNKSLRPTVVECPGAIEVLALALGMHDSSVQKIVLRAKVKRLILGTNKSWRTNTKKLTLLLRKPALHKTIPSAEAFFGLGELMAWGSDPVTQCFGRLSRLPKSAVCKLLNSLAEIAKESARDTTSGVITYKLLFTSNNFDAELRQQARACMRHPPRGYQGIYGFQNASLKLLEMHPVAFGSWIRNTRLPEFLYKSIAGQAVEYIQYGRPHHPLALSLLRSGVPFLQAIGAIGLAGDIYDEEVNLDFGEIYETALKITGKPTVAFVLSLYAVENLRVQSAICREKVATLSVRLRKLQRYPERAVGNTQNADRESEQVLDDLTKQKVRLTDIETGLECLSQKLDGILRSRPSLCDHLPELEQALHALAPEIMIRVGELLGRSDAADKVLDSVIDRGAKVIGLKEPISFKGTESLTVKQFEEVHEAMVRALELRYEHDPKGVARRTGSSTAHRAAAWQTVTGGRYRSQCSICCCPMANGLPAGVA